MKFIHYNLASTLIDDKNNFCEWIIESPILFSKYVLEVHNQTYGAEGNFVLSESDKEIDISKNIEVILDPFAINLNDKKIINKLYAELSQKVYEEENFLYTQEILSDLQKYFITVESSSDYMLNADSEIDITSVFKILNIKLEVYAESFFEKILQYIKIQAELMKRKIIIFINLRSYLSSEQIEELRKTAAYNELALVLIENTQKSCSLYPSHYIIIDKDGCEI